MSDFHLNIPVPTCPQCGKEAVDWQINIATDFESKTKDAGGKCSCGFEWRNLEVS